MPDLTMLGCRNSNHYNLIDTFIIFLLYCYTRIVKKFSSTHTDKCTSRRSFLAGAGALAGGSLFSRVGLGQRIDYGYDVPDSYWVDYGTYDKVTIGSDTFGLKAGIRHLKNIQPGSGQSHEIGLSWKTFSTRSSQVMRPSVVVDEVTVQPAGADGNFTPEEYWIKSPGDDNDDMLPILKYAIQAAYWAGTTVANVPAPPLPTGLIQTANGAETSDDSWSYNPNEFNNEIGAKLQMTFNSEDGDDIADTQYSLELIVRGRAITYECGSTGYTCSHIDTEKTLKCALPFTVTYDDRS